MEERMLIDELAATRRRSLAILPVAAVCWLALACVVYTEGLHRSEDGFLAGVLVGIFGYWVILELITVIKVGRRLREAGAIRNGRETSDSASGTQAGAGPGTAGA